jgi:xanthine dehydrogenase iron-sulfur cluster and FAD-binding subunit A
LHARLPADDHAAARRRIPIPDDDQIRHYLSGNLCRCAAYPEIINAVKIAARKRGRPFARLMRHRNCRDPTAHVERLD